MNEDKNNLAMYPVNPGLDEILDAVDFTLMIGCIALTIQKANTQKS